MIRAKYFFFFLHRDILFPTVITLAFGKFWMNSIINNKLVKDQLKPPEEEEGIMFEGRKPDILEGHDV